MKKTIPSKRGYSYSYEILDELRITHPETGRVYEKQLEKDGCVWFSDLDECDENANTVICVIEDDDSLSWVSNNIHATNSLLEELDEIREHGGKLSYISAEAIQYIIEMEA